MTIADHPVVGEVGFAAWKSSDAFDPAYANAEVIERVRHDFAIFPQMTTGDVHLAVPEGAIVGRTLVLHILDVIAAEGHPLARISTHASNSTAIRLYERCGFEIVWRGIDFSKSMNVDLEKVRMEKRLV